MIGALVGIAGGFYNLFKMVSRLAPAGTVARQLGSSAPAAARAGRSARTRANELDASTRRPTGKA